MGKKLNKIVIINALKFKLRSKIIYVYLCVYNL